MFVEGKNNLFSSVSINFYNTPDRRLETFAANLQAAELQFQERIAELNNELAAGRIQATEAAQDSINAFLAIDVASYIVRAPNA